MPYFEVILRVYTNKLPLFVDVISSKKLALRWNQPDIEAWIFLQLSRPSKTFRKYLDSKSGCENVMNWAWPIKLNQILLVTCHNHKHEGEELVIATCSMGILKNKKFWTSILLYFNFMKTWNMVWCKSENELSDLMWNVWYFNDKIKFGYILSG